MISNVKQWREDNNLSASKAGRLLGMKRHLWESFESGKLSPKKTEALKAVLSHYPQRWKELVQLAQSINLARLKKLVFETGETAQSVSIESGLSFALLNGYMSKTYKFKSARLDTRLLIVNYFVSKGLLSLDPITEKEAIIVSESPSETLEKVDPIILEGQPWWVVADVCRSIGYTTTTHAHKLIDHDDLQKVQTVDSIGRNIEQWATNEPGLYQFLLRCNTDKAKPFKRWVTSEVLPTIRKTGSYNAKSEPVNTLDALIIGLQELKAAQAEIGEIKAEVKQIASATDERLNNIEEMVSPERAAEIVVNEAQWTNNAKCWVRDCADKIVRESIERGSMEGRSKLYSSFWRSHNRFVGVSSHGNICCVAEAERSMMFTKNYAQTRAINLPEFQTAINFNDLLKSKKAAI